MADRITPRKEDYSRWYTDVVTQSRMADVAARWKRAVARQVDEQIRKPFRQVLAK